MKIAFFEIKDQEQKQFFKNVLPEHELIFFEDSLTAENLPGQNDFEIISTFVNCQIDHSVIDYFPKLKLIAARATGFDNIDVSRAKEKNIAVSNVPSYGSHTVAEFTFSLILSLSRKIPQAVQRLKATGEFSYENLRGMDIYGKTLGVAGTGKIGLNVIKIAKAFGMPVLAYDLYPNQQACQDLGFKYTDLDTLLSQSDILTIHTPLNENTHHLINEKNIFKMKKGALLINTARGGVVATDALFKAITSNHIAGAALDVLEGEKDIKEELEIFSKNYPQDLKTMLENHILLDLEQVLITPHMAFYTKEAEEAIRQTTADNIRSFILGKVVNLVL